MGCDYYIFKVLHIYYNDTEYLDVTLHRKRGYYDYEEQDEDEADTPSDFEARTGAGLAAGGRLQQDHQS